MTRTGHDSGEANGRLWKVFPCLTLADTILSSSSAHRIALPIRTLARPKSNPRRSPSYAPVLLYTRSYSKQILFLQLIGPTSILCLKVIKPSTSHIDHLRPPLENPTPTTMRGPIQALSKSQLYRLQMHEISIPQR